MESKYMAPFSSNAVLGETLVPIPILPPLKMMLPVLVSPKVRVCLLVVAIVAGELRVRFPDMEASPERSSVNTFEPEAEATRMF